MPHRVDPESFGFLVTDLARLIRAEMDRRIGEADLGLTPGEARTLVHAARGGALRQNVLAERMGVEAMTVTGYLDRLEGRGLVRRAADPTDRRAKLVQLTEAGDAMLGAILPVSAGIRADALKGIGVGDWEAFQRVVKAARVNLTATRAEAALEASEA